MNDHDDRARRNSFESAYHWRTALGHRQAESVVGRIDMADEIAGSVLDAGCGTEEDALFFAGRGCTVTRIDFVEEAFSRAKRKAIERALSAAFLLKDALGLTNWSERFDNVIDGGLFHVLSEADRRRYVGAWRRC